MFARAQEVVTIYKLRIKARRESCGWTREFNSMKKNENSVNRTKQHFRKEARVAQTPPCHPGSPTLELWQPGSLLGELNPGEHEIPSFQSHGWRPASNPSELWSLESVRPGLPPCPPRCATILGGFRIHKDRPKGDHTLSLAASSLNLHSDHSRSLRNCSCTTYPPSGFPVLWPISWLLFKPAPGVDQIRWQ